MCVGGEGAEGQNHTKCKTKYFGTFQAAVLKLDNVFATGLSKATQWHTHEFCGAPNYRVAQD